MTKTTKTYSSLAVQICVQQFKDGDGHHFEKKLRCLHTRSTDFDKILPFDAHWPPTAEHVKISNFLKSKMVAAAMKNCSISQPHMTTHTLI